MSEEEPFLHALEAFRPFLSASRLRELPRFTGSPRAAWEADDALLQSLHWTEEQCARFHEHRQNWNVAVSYERLQGSGIEIIPENDERFPRLLTEIFDPPLLLYVRGELRAEEVAVAVVGSRNATPYGKTATNLLVRPLASREVLIVSGLAYGIDAEAHRAALAVHGRTVAVLGSGADDASLYPRAHRQLAADIVAKGGAVVSEYAPGTRPQGYFFPQRNRLISGLAHAVVVVEADEQSGALITARSGLEQNREVFAVPGPITSPLSRGTNTLLREGAAPARRAEDILDALELSQVLSRVRDSDGEPAPSITAPPDDAQALLLTLSAQPLGIDEIVNMSTLPPNVVASLLTVLELDGRVRDVGSRQYIRV
jgi:DNA processing protein